MAACVLVVVVCILERKTLTSRHFIIALQALLAVLGEPPFLPVTWSNKRKTQATLHTGWVGMPSHRSAHVERKAQRNSKGLKSGVWRMSACIPQEQQQQKPCSAEKGKRASRASVCLACTVFRCLLDNVAKILEISYSSVCRSCCWFCCCWMPKKPEGRRVCCLVVCWR